MIYRTLFYVNIYGSYKLLKTVRFLAHPLQWYNFCREDTHAEETVAKIDHKSLYRIVK